MKEKNIEVLEDDKLIGILKSELADYSVKKIKKLIKYEMVSVDGKMITNASVVVFKGSIVHVSFSKQVLPQTDLNIIYEDTDIIVIDKPAGLLSIGNGKERNVTAYRMVSDYIKKENKRNKLFVVHRLDQGTSGVLLFAKNEVIKHKLQDNWNERVVKREYVAVVEGKMPKYGTIESYLTMNKAQIVHSTHDSENGWYAVTHYKTISCKNGYSLLEVNIDTGRRNQIRVHMSEAGHSVVGDKKYKAKTNPIGRLALHASKLYIIDPRTKKLLKLETKTPASIVNLVK